MKKVFTLVWSVLALLMVTNVTQAQTTLYFGNGTSSGWSLYTDDGLTTAYTEGKDNTWSAEANKLTLNGFNFTTTAGTALVLNDATTIILTEGTDNSFTSGNINSVENFACVDADENNLTIEGAGSLTITSGNNTYNESSGTVYITGLRAGVLTLTDGTITVAGGTAKHYSYGIHAQTELKIDGATVVSSSQLAGSTYGVRAGRLIMTSGSLDTSAKGSTTSRGLYLQSGTNSAITGGTITASVADYGMAIYSVGEIAGVSLKGGASSNDADPLVYDTNNNFYKVEDSSDAAKYAVMTVAPVTLYFGKNGEDVWSLYTDPGFTTPYAGNDGKWEAAEEKLTLNGFEFETIANTALEMSANSTLTLAEDSKNTITTTASTGVVKGLSIKGYDTFTINGSGSLTVTAGDSDNNVYAINGSGKVIIDGVHLDAKTGETTGDVSVGIYGDEGVEIKNGALVKASAGEAAISSMGINVPNGADAFEVGSDCEVVIQGYTYAICVNGLATIPKAYYATDYNGVGAVSEGNVFIDDGDAYYHIDNSNVLWMQIGGELPAADQITFTWKREAGESKQIILYATNYSGDNVEINWGNGDVAQYEVANPFITSPEYSEAGDYTVTITSIVTGVHLTQLTIRGMNVSDLDVSGAPELVYLDCSNNQLATLEVSENTALTDLYCEYNQLTTLDVSGNTALTDLYCEYNQLTALDVSENTELIHLYCNNNQLTTLDVSENTALETLCCYENAIPLSDLKIASDIIEEQENKRFGTQTFNLQSMEANKPFNLEGEMTLGSSDTQTTFEVSKDDDDAILNTDYILDYDNETITFLTTGSFEIILTNSAIESQSGFDAKVIMTFDVKDGSTPGSDFYTINLEVAAGIELNNMTAGNHSVGEGSHLHLQFLPEDRTLGAADILFLVDGVETAFTELGENNYFSYILNPVTADHTILVALKEYPVILTETEGVTYNVGAGTHRVGYGEKFTFSLTLADGIDPEKVHVYANGREILPDALRAVVLTYTIDKVITPITVVIEGAGDPITGNPDIAAGKIQIAIDNGQWTIDNSAAIAVDVTVYNVSGQSVVSLRGLRGSQTVRLQPGVYIVKAGSEIFKVSVN